MSCARIQTRSEQSVIRSEQKPSNEGFLLQIETLADGAQNLKPRGVYCTVVAQNYLPQALALYSSVRAIEPDRELIILVVDADRRELEVGRSHLRIATTADLGISEREVLNLAAIYDVVEFSTAVKPLFFKSLLETYEQVVYLDPDTFLLSPLVELEPLVDEHGIVLTPHFLKPIPGRVTHISEVHSLTVGVHNLGFCAVGRTAIPFLDWWWSHLRRECLIYPLLGIFVDQKWTDVGATLFGAHSLQHFGYNVGPWNLHERSFSDVDGEWKLDSSEDHLRLFHFSGFNPDDPDAISIRLSLDMRGTDVGSPSLSALSRTYADAVLAARLELGPAPAYGFARDTRGQVITKRVRRAFRKSLLEREGWSPPSPFLQSEVSKFRSWKRSSVSSRLGLTAGDAALAAKYVFPDEFSRVKTALPKQFRWVRQQLLSASKVRR